MAEERKDPALCPNRQLDPYKVRAGYYNAEREYEYWVPQGDIVGEIPRSLHGTLYRNGPGLMEVYGTKLVHPIDGDGMIVALTFINGEVHLRSKFVVSKHRTEEQQQEKLFYRGQMGTHPNSALKDTALYLKSLITFSKPRLQYRNPSNTNVFYWGGKLLSVYETGLPYVLDPHTLNTLGPENFNGALRLKQFAAHFRIDSQNQRLICMGLRPGVGRLKPILALYEFDVAWNLHQCHIHSIEGLNYAHDLLLLPDYYIIHMTPFVSLDWWTVSKVVMGWGSFGSSMKHYPNLPSRFIVIPRHKQAKYQEVLQLDTEPFHIFHYGVAEQKGEDVITFNAVCLPPNFTMEYCPEEATLTNSAVAPGKLHSFVLHLDTGKCEGEGEVDQASVEFPTTHPYRHGHTNTRYSYLMASDRGSNVPYRDVIKHDVKGESRQVWYSHGVVGEPVFVPRLGHSSCSKGDEDDGYVLVQLYIPETHTTEFVVLDAKQIHAGPLARIKLKHAIPYGFHGTFTPHVFIPAARVLSPPGTGDLVPGWARAKL